MSYDYLSLVKLTIKIILLLNIFPKKLLQRLFGRVGLLNVSICTSFHKTNKLCFVKIHEFMSFFPYKFTFYHVKPIRLKWWGLRWEKESDDVLLGKPSLKRGIRPKLIWKDKLENPLKHSSCRLFVVVPSRHDMWLEWRYKKHFTRIIN